MPLLKNQNQFVVLAPTRQELDLLDEQDVLGYFDMWGPNVVLHMAAVCGGIGANKDSPAVFLESNLRMATNLFQAISKFQMVDCFYGLGSVCAYPKFTPVPFKETDIWNGMPEETNFPYGHAKRTLMLLQQTYREQYNLKGAHLIPVNMYGEYDHFSLRNSHVIPALIRKIVNAKDTKLSSVEVWGDGTPTREFLYAGDCAKIIAQAVLSKFDYSEPINIGTGVDISIYDLAHKIKSIIGYDGEIVFTNDKDLNGQPRRRLDVSRAKSFGFVAETDLDTGLRHTVEWYQKNKLSGALASELKDDK
jgi:GDP-L-fucose synthase